MTKYFKKIIYILTILLSLLGIIFSLLNIISYFIDQKNNNNQLSNVKDIAKIKEINDNTKTLNSNNKDKTDPYWEYIKMNLIDVDFDSLEKVNSDIKGWIKVNGTNINYPFVQTNNNDYYLNHSLDKTKNIGGWVFLDYRNNLSDTTDKNTIIYAHGMRNKTMFGTLKNIFSNDWLNDTNNHVVKISTRYEDTLWQVFSVYKITTTNDYLKINFNNDSKFENFNNMIISRSIYKFNTKISKDDRILTLSTCYNDTEKVVLHAKLIKWKEKKS